jgi:hypothetical protein
MIYYMHVKLKLKILSTFSDFQKLDKWEDTSYYQ